VVATQVGRTIADEVAVTLDDGAHVAADVAIVAHGTCRSWSGCNSPTRPAWPWTGTCGVGPCRGLYAGGGIAMHHRDAGRPYRIDNWDAAPQGRHATQDSPARPWAIGRS